MRDCDPTKAQKGRTSPNRIRGNNQPEQDTYYVLDMDGMTSFMGAAWLPRHYRRSDSCPEMVDLAVINSSVSRELIYIRSLLSTLSINRLD